MHQGYSEVLHTCVGACICFRSFRNRPVNVLNVVLGGVDGENESDSISCMVL